MDKLKIDSPDWDLRINFKCSSCGSFKFKAADLVPHFIEMHCENKFFKCYICKTYSSDKYQNLSQHIQDKHGLHTNIIACPICYHTVSLAELPENNNSIDFHIIKHHWEVKQVYCCNLCSYKCEKEINQHILKTHKENSLSNNTEVSKRVQKNFSCKMLNCTFKDTNPIGLFQHIMNCHFPKLEITNNCPFCDLLFKGEKPLAQHMRDKHGFESLSDDVNITITCNLCENYNCEKKETYAKHLKSKHSLIVFHCPFGTCSYNANKFWKFAEHVNDEHITKLTYNCPMLQCQASYAKEFSLKQHLETKHANSLEPYCHCTAYIGNRMEHLEDIHGLIMETEVCRLCNVRIFDDEFDIHMNATHKLYFPEGIDELYDDG